MGKSIIPVLFTSDKLALTVTECSISMERFINKTVTLNEFSKSIPHPHYVNVFEVIDNNGCELRFESTDGDFIQGF